jgi:hypothetical protein
MQQQDQCTCANAAKAPTEKEMKRVRLAYKPYSKTKETAKSKFKGKICFATQPKTETLPECPLGYGRNSIITGYTHCKFRGKEKSLNNLSICLYKAGKEGVPHKQP